jgi:hypothetical protein
VRKVVLGAHRDADGFHELEGVAYGRLVASVADKDWAAHVKKPFRKSSHVIQYLGRYTHRVGIANSRLLEVTDEQVTFRTKHGRTATLAPVESLARLVQHVLPPGFRKIRHAGLYASAQPGGLLEQARQALGDANHQGRSGRVCGLPKTERSPALSGWELAAPRPLSEPFDIATSCRPRRPAPTIGFREPDLLTIFDQAPQHRGKVEGALPGCACEAEPPFVEAVQHAHTRRWVPHSLGTEQCLP